ncbi:MAG: PBECR2 nuclease fold domain-containing protein [Lachnospiraceae bacterium]|nr:PBECR2 nuclease fold domain-containing protein [Lachnospiraceae bacterium]
MPITPAELEALPTTVEQYMEELAAAVLLEIIERIKDGREISSTTDYLIYRYDCIKGFTAAVKRHIQAAIEASEAEINRIFDEVLQEQYVRDATIYRELAKREITPFAENAELQQYIQAIKAQTKKTFENITQTTGYMVKNNGKLQMTPPAAVLQRSLDRAVGQVLEGTETYNNAIRDVVKELTDSDLRTVNYDSGKTYDVASAARMCLLTGVTQVTGHITENNMRELGTEYVEVSWHATARPSHQVWQGRVFHWKGFLGAEKSDSENRTADAVKDSVKTAGSNGKGKIEVHSIGKIDKEIYKCITEDIVSDEVIITDERIEHIKERHPNDYERFYGYMKEIVSNPDYIIEANRPNTALILKELEGQQFKTVLRFVTSADNVKYKNSIITFMRIKNKEWNRLLKNKKILYRKE